MTPRPRLLLALAAVLAGMAAVPAAAREQIRAVGSSTVFPFTTAVAETFGRTMRLRTPIVESTGTGGGFRLFCAGIGEQYPDIANASRPITGSEKSLCKQNGVTAIVEVKIGFDGIVLANARRAPVMRLTLTQVWQALAREVPDASGKLVANPYRTWSDIDPSLPAARIEVMGPPPTSGTRDAFVELVLNPGCAAHRAMAAIKAADAQRYTVACAAVREDGAYVEAGENDVLIVRKLEANPDAFGIFGFATLLENEDRVQGSVVNGVRPDFETIANGTYPVARGLYFYVKKQHMNGVAPGLADFIRAYTEERAIGPDGYLADHGLIPLPEADRQRVRQQARALSELPL